VGPRELPSGTVTFLFTDVEGSTRLLREYGAGYADLLAKHRRALRDAFTIHSGVEVDTQGDAFFVAFRRAADAVAAANDARTALEGSPIRVRMGVHTGEPIVTEEGYIGIDVHRAARIAAAAHGGQIILSETTRGLLDRAAPVRELGEHRLKDMIEAERLYQLGEGDFPPLRTLDATNLPIASTALLGREDELEELVALLSNGTRLLTITGPGGTGKTRLALQVAAELVGTLNDGVFWVPLVGLSDPELMSSAVAQAIGAPDDLAGFLRGRELLILLDNFEHLLDAAPAVSTVLAVSSGLRVLVTSRAPLRVSGEREYRLEPLPAKDAAALFVERARAIGRELAPDSTVEAICRRVDGLPLAVELAAARTKLLAPERRLERLDSALPILTGGARDAHKRQHTLRATIEWSYDLLDEASKELFSRLSVFAGSFPVGAAEEVCGADLDGVAALVDTSLLKPIRDDRFMMLETIREYALERLEGSPEADELHRRHASFFSTVTEQAYEGRFGAESEWSARLELDHDDLRAALDFLAASDPDRALELAGALGWFWLSHGHLAEGRGRLNGALAGSAAGGRPRARALTAAGSLVARLGDADAGRVHLDEGARLWRDLGDLNELASALDTLVRSWASAKYSLRWGTPSGPNRSLAICSGWPMAIRVSSTSLATSSPTARCSATTARRPSGATVRACGRRFRSETSSRRASRSRVWRCPSPGSATRSGLSSWPRLWRRSGNHSAPGSPWPSGTCSSSGTSGARESDWARTQTPYGRRAARWPSTTRSSSP